MIRPVMGAYHWRPAKVILKTKDLRRIRLIAGDSGFSI